MDAREVYLATRTRLFSLAGEMGEAGARPVPALPGWSVRDTVAHLAGVCSDVVEGRLDGMPGDAWTARQLAERRGVALPGLLSEWERRGPELDAVLAGPGGRDHLPAVIDAWAHEQDIRGALGRHRPAGCPEAAFVADRLARALRRGWAASGRAPIRIVGESAAWDFGEGTPAATLHATDFELARAFIGRRSRRQMLAMSWDGDPDPFIDHLHVFGPPAGDLVE